MDRQRTWKAGTQAFLDIQQSIVLLEDMDLSQHEPGMSIIQVFVGPLSLKNSNASPCTVLAEVDL